jgi:predicted membrane-bound mannosyltransferase/streptogramin lyase
MQDTLDRKSLFDTPFIVLWKLNWEHVLLVLLIVAAILTRFWDLGYRAYNHDESIHTDWSWNLYTGRGYQHNPIYHGPLLYLATALTFGLVGDNDVTGRIPNALFGIVLVALPYFFRKWLGTKGALATSAMLLISPAVLYYSRFNRHDVYVDVFTILIALVIWKYFDDRQDLWLYSAAALLALSFAAMETTFIFLAVFAIFLCGHFTFVYLRPRVKWGESSLCLFAAFFGIPFFGLFVAFKFVRALFGRMTIVDWSDIPSFNLAMIFGTLSLPLITPAFIYALNIIWKPIFGAEFYPVGGFTDATTITTIAQSQPDVLLRVLALTFIVILISALVGFWWNARVWVVGAVLFWPIFVFFFTTAFTNGQGFFTGLLGSLGYWLSQQGVARGGQPAYYYLLVQLPLYEFLPYTVGIAAMCWYWWRHRPTQLVVLLGWLLVIILFAIAYFGISTDISGLRALLGPNPGIVDQIIVLLIGILIPLVFFSTFDSNDAASFFPTFIFVWAVGNLIIFSWAGEKMPWLVTHLTLPLAFVSGWAFERLVNVDWRDFLARGATWVALIILLALVLLFSLLTTRPFQGLELDQLNGTIGFLFALLALGFVAGAFVFLSRRFAWREIARIAAVTLIALLAGLTVHSAWLAVYQNPDVAVETIIYAQGSPDVPVAMREIEDLSRRLCAQTGPGKQTIQCDNGTIKVAYDDDSSWPFVWYLRNYRNAQFYGASPNAPFDAPIVIVGPKNEDAVKGFLGSKYTKRTYKLIWWPLEGYKDLSLDRIWSYIVDPQQRADLFTAWFYHKYKESLSQWPYVHNFSFYVRKDVATLVWNYSSEIAPQPQPEDEYAKKQVQLDASRVFGSQGVGRGQFSNPKNLAIDSQGNVYVADSDNGRIQKFDANGKFLLAWGTRSPENAIGPRETFNQPWGIAVDKSGGVYVADTWNHRIQKFDSNGKFLTMWGENGDTRGIAQDQPTKFYGPRAIAADSSGNLLVTDTGNKRVLKFSPDGAPLGQYGGLGVDNGQFQEPVGIAVDAQGNIFVADTWNQRIQKFDKNFNFTMQWPIVAWDSQSVVNKPYLAVDTDGNVFVTDPEGSRVIKFTNDGKLVSVFGQRGTDMASFNLPTGLAFDGQGNLYVADSANNRILIFTKP